MIKVQQKAFAKINFGLNVLPRREDGFHDIEGIFQTIDLFDELDIEVMQNSFEQCKVLCKTIELPEKNTVTEAYKAFCEIVGPSVKVPSVSVEIVKGIPAGGGLGGGSADAGALVRGMEKICNIKLSEEQKNYIAAKTGSDVFFFMYTDSDGKGCALVSGRGEIVKNIKARDDLYLVMIFPRENSITKEAYSSLDKYYENGNSVKCPLFSELEFIYNKSVSEWTFKNSFTPVVKNQISEVREALGDLQISGCSYSEMSGSGSTVYGVFTSKQQADKIKMQLEKKWCCKLVHVN